MDRYDVAVIGGGTAGLSGALALARARRTVLVIDAGRPRNEQAAHAHNYLTRDGAAPGDLLAAGRAEALRYGAEIVVGKAIAAEAEAGGFVVTLAEGGNVRARRLLVTTGLADELPEIPGLAAHWGRQVLHCPYCHGWEVRDQRIGVLSGDSMAPTHALLWRQWSEHVLLFTHDAAPPRGDEAERLAARGIPVVEGPVAEVVARDGALMGVRLADGEVVELDALVVAPRMSARGGVLESLGLKPVDAVVGEHVAGSRFEADETGATAVPGVWIAGNVADVRAQLITSAASGLTAGAAINADLVAADTRAALDAYRSRIAEMSTQEAWDDRYHSRHSLWSGRPNPQLVAEVSGLPARRALDVGCGEGADAIWLAGRGWRVDAVDISAVALERAAANAARAGGEIAARIDWIHANLSDRPPAEGAYDLVSAQFMQLPPEPRRALFARLAAATAPGGLLLIVGHHPSDLRTSAHRMHFPDMMYTAEQVASTLDPQRWQVLSAESRARTATDPEGREIVIHDAVLAARRER